MLMIVVAGSLSVLCIGKVYEVSSEQQLMLTCVTASFMVALQVHCLNSLTRAIGWVKGLVPEADSVRIGSLVRASMQVTWLIALASIAVSIGMIATSVDPPVIQVTIAAVALVSWATVELAERSRTETLRQIAVGLGLIAIGLWASVDLDRSAHPWLSASMRWLVASVFAIPMMLFAIPKLLGTQISAQWYPALHRGALVSAGAACGSLLVMLAIEAVVRTPQGIEGIARPMVIGVAITLAVLSLIASLVAILSGPTKNAYAAFGLDRLTDDQRRILVLLAQAIGAVTWLHVFLCKANWAFIGLRSYWPYIVMGIAFVSVGVTEWSKRRGDRVLADMLSHTSLYLPLIPVVGFWLSGSLDELGWFFTGGRVRYEILLMLGACYYIGLSAIWKQLVPRVAAIVLG
ncbi:MAG: hypothetical protein MI861_13830, partial [Pirellulales bacterium]|nr:hypothetical protein [Pirellulales bacterium]